MSNYPENTRGTNMDRDVSEPQLQIEAHRAAIRNTVAFAFKQWPLGSHTMQRRNLIDAAVTTAMCAIEEKLPVSSKMAAKAIDERLRYLDANRDNDQEAVMQCLESMLCIYELWAEEAV